MTIQKNLLVDTETLLLQSKQHKLNAGYTTVSQWTAIKTELEVYQMPVHHIKQTLSKNFKKWSEDV